MIDYDEINNTLSALEIVKKYCDKHDRGISSQYIDEDGDGFSGDMVCFYEGLDDLRSMLEKKKEKRYLSTVYVREVVDCGECEFKERCFRNLKFVNENGSTSTGLLHWCSIGRKKDE